jgi:hypothetical protein
MTTVVFLSDTSWVHSIPVRQAYGRWTLPFEVGRLLDETVFTARELVA